MYETDSIRTTSCKRHLFPSADIISFVNAGSRDANSPNGRTEHMPKHPAALKRFQKRHSRSIVILYHAPATRTQFERVALGGYELDEPEITVAEAEAGEFRVHA